MLVRVQLGGEERRMGVDEFEGMCRSGEVGPETPVERDGGWVAAAEWPGFAALRASPAAALMARWREPAVPWVTAITIGLATRIFIGANLDPTQGAYVYEALVRNTPDVFERGESWRLLSYALLHANLPHLLSNAAGILVAGLALERLLGSVAMLAVLSSSVLVGGLLSAIRLPEISTVGISAGDFGVLGACAALGVRFGGLLPRGAQAAFGSVAALMTLQFFSGGLTAAGVDNWAHFGGLVAGLLLGAIYRPAIPAWRRHNRMVHGLVASAALITLVGIGLFGHRMIPWTAYAQDGVAAERPAWWGVQVSRSGGRGFGAPDRESAVSLSSSKLATRTEPRAVLAGEIGRIARLDPQATVSGESAAGAEARAVVAYLADGQRRVATYRVAVRGLYATIGVVDVRAEARLEEALVRRTLDQWSLVDPPAVAKARAQGSGWKAKMDSAIALAEFGELDEASVRFDEARAANPLEDDIDVAEVRVLHALGDPRGAAVATEALVRFPESRKLIAAAALVGVQPPYLGEGAAPEPSEFNR